MPVVDRSSGEPPPFVIVVQGPPQVFVIGVNQIIFGTGNDHCEMFDSRFWKLICQNPCSGGCVRHTRASLKGMDWLLILNVRFSTQVGKTLLIKSLVKHYTKHNLSDIRGPITVVSGEGLIN